MLRADLRTQVVDHISGNVYDHRRKNLRVADASSNKQNARLPRRNESGYIGVYLLANKTYRAACFVKGENRTVGRNFAAHELDEAIEIYDLVSFYKHGPGALVNRPDMISRYLEMLELDETEQRTPLPSPGPMTTGCSPLSFVDLGYPATTLPVQATCIARRVRWMSQSR